MANEVWFEITNKATREKTIVAEPEGATAPDVDPDEYDWVQLEREPGEFEDVVNGQIVLNEERKAASEEEALERRLNRRRFGKRVLRRALLEMVKINRQLGKYTPAEAQAARDYITTEFGQDADDS